VKEFRVDWVESFVASEVALWSDGLHVARRGYLIRCQSLSLWGIEFEVYG
jgi:hypothetical protein